MGAPDPFGHNAGGIFLSRGAVAGRLPADHAHLAEKVHSVLEDSAVSLLESYVNKTPFLELKGKFNSAVNALPVLGNAPVELLFLDIQMQGMDGERTAEEIRKMDDSVVLVFYTGFAEPTPHSFEVQPYRFMKKNMPPQEKSRHILAALDRMAELDLGPVFEARFDGGRLFLKPDDIVYIEKYRRGIRIHVSPAAKRRYHRRLGG